MPVGRIDRDAGGKAGVDLADRVPRGVVLFDHAAEDDGDVEVTVDGLFGSLSTASSVGRLDSPDMPDDGRACRWCRS